MSNSTSISGVVTTTSGEVLPGALITIESASLPSPRTTVTNPSGHYRFVEILPGEYVVNASMTGFNPQQRRNVLVRIDQSVTVDFQLSLETS